MKANSVYPGLILSLLVWAWGIASFIGFFYFLMMAREYEGSWTAVVLAIGAMWLAAWLFKRLQEYNTRLALGTHAHAAQAGPAPERPRSGTPKSDRGGGKMLTVKVNRDSVSLFDDIEAHGVTMAVAETSTALELLGAAEKACPLPQIEGGDATWIVYTGDGEEHCLGVVAQQWSAPALLAPVQTTAKTIFAGGVPEMFFHYATQSDPHEALKRLKSNE